MARRRPVPTFECPHCGAAVKRGALACPECGADAETGWSEEAELGGLELPAGYDGEEEFDYDEFLAREGLGAGGPVAARLRRRALVRLVAVALLALLFVWWILR